MRAAINFVLVLAVFALLGPPIGAVIFMIAATAWGGANGVDLAGLGWVGVFAAIYAAPLSFIFGALPALASGGIVASRMTWSGRIGLPYAVLTGCAVGLATIILSGQSLGRPGSGQAGSVALFLACLVATVVCSLIARALFCGRRVPAAT
jgi:hypothetical protein